MVVLDDFPLLIPAVLRNNALTAKEHPLQELIQPLALIRCRLDRQKAKQGRPELRSAY
jgi:hypothetical protein